MRESSYEVINVRVGEGINGPKMCLEGDSLKKDKWTLKMTKSGVIQFDLHDNTGNWRFGCIEFEEKGACEFKADKVSEKDTQITVENLCTRKDEFKYTIWIVPRTGFGAPKGLDPIVDNDPEGMRD